MEATELIIGKVYRDTPIKHDISTYLKFVGYDDMVGSADFEYVSGKKWYFVTDGVISFAKNVPFYELEPNETY